MPRTTSTVVTRLVSAVASPPMSNRYPTPCSETRASKAIEGRPSRSRRNGARIAARPRALSAGRRDSSFVAAIAHAASARGSTRWVYRASSPTMASRAKPGDALSSKRHPRTSNVAECRPSVRTELFGEEDRPDTGPERSSAATAGPRIQSSRGRQRPHTLDDCVVHPSHREPTAPITLGDAARPRTTPLRLRTVPRAAYRPFRAPSPLGRRSRGS